MRGSGFTVLMVLVCGGVAMAQEAEVRTSLKFRHLKPSEFVAQLAETRPVVQLPPANALPVQPVLKAPLPLLSGVSALTPDDKAGRLAVQGTAEAVSGLRKLVSLMDVRRSSSVTLRYRMWFSGWWNRPERKVVASGSILDSDRRQSGTTLMVNRLPFRLETAARRNGDGSAMVRATLTMQQGEQKATGDSDGVKRLHLVETTSTFRVPVRIQQKNSSAQMQLSTRDGVYELEFLPVER